MSGLGRKRVASPKQPTSSQVTAAKLVKRSLSWSPQKTPRKLVTPRRGRKPNAWSEDELRALVQFVAQHKSQQGNIDTEWPGMRVDHQYWLEASEFIEKKACAQLKRKAGAIRSQVCKLKERFKTVLQAKVHTGATSETFLEQNALPKSLIDIVKNCTAEQLKHICHLCFSLLDSSLVAKVVSDKVQEYEQVALEELVEGTYGILEQKGDGGPLLNKLVSRFFTNKSFGNCHNFITLHLRAMQTLNAAGKNPYLVMKFAQCIAVKRPNSPDISLMPLNRMPFGLVQYQIEFFTATHIRQVKESIDYRLWRETMSSELQGRQDRILRGPMWSGCALKDRGVPIKARVNVACVSGRTLNTHQAQNTMFSSDPVIQIGALKSLKLTSKRVWLKADACDIKVALQESLRGDWNGDAELNDGQLEAIRAEFDQRVASLSSSLHDDPQMVSVAVQEVVDAVSTDIPFLRDGLAAAVTIYQLKVQQARGSQQVLMTSCWNVADYNQLSQQAEAFLQQYRLLKALLDEGQNVQAREQLSKIKTGYRDYLRNLYKKKRRAATHVMVILAADEERSQKPYAVPVQYIPYHSIKDQFIRDMTAGIKRALTALNVLVVGTVTDGEFCSLRSQGETRPLHIWQLVHDAKEAVKSMSQATLISMLFTDQVDAEGHPVIRRPNPAVPEDVIQGLFELQHIHGWTIQQCISHYRQRLVPHGYNPYSFRRNTPESSIDELRSLMATFFFRKAVNDWKAEGIDFSMYMYVPEVDPITQAAHHERSDHCHILKRIAGHTRELRYPRLKPGAFEAAMQDPHTGLTHAALIGARKQSVADAEKLLSFHVARFMDNHNHPVEGEYVRRVAEWHEASDGRGLSELQRCRQNYRMLSYLVMEWIPWFQDMPDYSTLDINRPMDDIRGFSRETFVEITTNIESQESRRCMQPALGPEHPRAGTTDDNEMFFCLCHRYLGDNFTLKDFKYRWQKLAREFCKRMDAQLPFYYWTVNERYHVMEEDFNQPPEDGQDEPEAPNHPLRLRRLRVNRREDAAVFAAGRALLPARNRPTIRQQVHRFDVGLPPVPDHLLPPDVQPNP